MKMGVKIQTGSRLHFGLLAHRPQVGRHFGGVGLMIDSPGVKLSVTPSQSDEIIGPASTLERVQNIIAKFRRQTSKERQTPPCRVEIHRVIPAHQGLGSGTQLALAVGKALAVAAGEAEIPILELARRVGRGKRSALGIHGFQRGGFLVDGGKRNLEEVGTLVWQRDFPADWRVVLVRPAENAGLSGTDEVAAFQHLAGMPGAMTDRLCRLVLMELLPAILEKDFRGVCEAISEYGLQVGTYFEPIQGGKLASEPMEHLAGWLRNRGHLGVGQSSWGPTIFVLQASQSAAELLVRELQQDSPWADCTFQIASPYNRGAVLEME